jgi:hypothetical protein
MDGLSDKLDIGIQLVSNFKLKFGDYRLNMVIERFSTFF